jgi:hypothetical protein
MRAVPPATHADVAAADRFIVVTVDAAAGTFIAAPVDDAPWPTAGDAFRWYPAYRVAVADTGFGPRPTPAAPHARAQIAASSVRRSTTRPAESPPSPPATVHAIDTTPSPAPTLPPIPTGDRCAQLATAADFYGLSRFNLTWHPVPGAAGYHIHRAMDDSVRHADIAAHGIGQGTQPHVVAAADLPTDPSRQAAVTADLASLDTALAGADPATIRDAYRAMRADAWQLIASQDAVASAYVRLNGQPTTATTFEDRFDGVAECHWFYRISTINMGGLESEFSPSTPPICAPRTTPPRPPQALQATAADGGVSLRFAPSPSANIVHYRVYRTFDRARADNVRDMLERARLTPPPASTRGAGEEQPEPDGTALKWTDAAATPGQQWFYRIIAEDVWGNRSEPSAVLAARSLYAPPAPPTWVPATRSGMTVHLRWTHPDPRLACVVERRFDNGPWAVIGERPLPRGVYTLDDVPPAPVKDCEYRLTVIDHANQTASTKPILPVPGVPR